MHEVGDSALGQLPVFIIGYSEELSIGPRTFSSSHRVQHSFS